VFSIFVPLTETMMSPPMLYWPPWTSAVLLPPRKPAWPAGPPAATDSMSAEKTESLIIDGNVRSGQSIVHPEGDVTVVGRVASGAEIVAGGSVHVYGLLQGRVIAGISGSPSARVFCKEARAELISIGGVYVTAETMSPRVEGRSLEVRLAEDELKLRILD